MYRRVDCRKYWQWRRQQEKKSKEAEKKVKKRKRKETVTDCIEDVEQKEVAETILKVSHPKCKKEKKKKSTDVKIKQLIKRIPPEESILQCIKPSMEIREYFLNPRHLDCLQFSLSKIDFPLENVQTLSSLPYDEDEEDNIESNNKVECKSICSSDSLVCLAGTKLTPKDKEKIKKYQGGAEVVGARED